MKVFIIVCSLFSLMQISFGQVSFSQMSADRLPSQIQGGVAMAIADIDGDMHDDIVTTNSGKDLTIYCYRGADVPYEMVFSTPMTSSWSVTVGDVTSDGKPDILVANSNSIILLKQSSISNFEKSILFIPEWLPQGSNLVDLDNDRDLDYFICNDEGDNVILLNDGNGVFTESEVIDFSTVPESDNSGNYSSIWTDIDNDNDLDLYIGKCRVGATTFDDPRRINVLLINNGDGSFTESAADFGLADPYQSWSIDSGDIDNDGDFDILVTNHDGPHNLYINEGSTFTKFDYGEPIVSFAFQGVFHDVDNNGWLDMVITDGKYNYILYNDNMAFTKREYQIGGAKPHSSILTDFNHDGFIDIWGAYPGGGFIGSASNIAQDRIWINEGNTNDYINIKLEDDLNAGAKVKLSGPFGSMVREIKLGSSYGQQSSSMLHFGMGSNAELYDLEIIWPDRESQSIDVSNLKLNETYVITKNGCMSKIERVLTDNSFLLCDSENITIYSENSNEVMWVPLGLTNSELTINEKGSFRYEYIDSTGCKHYSDYQNTVSESDYYSDILGVRQLDFTVLCKGDTYEITSQEAESYLWSNDETSRSIIVDDSGEYAVTIETACGNYLTSKSIELLFTEVDKPELVGDVIELGTSGTITSDQDSTYWYESSISTAVIGRGITFETEQLFESRFYYARAINNEYITSGFVGIDQGPDTLAYSGNHINSGLVFEVYNPIRINSVAVETDSIGPRQILITKDGELVYSEAFVLEPGVTRLELGISLGEGSYVMSTDSEVNNTVFGHNGPRLTRVQDLSFVNYPYILGNDLSINNSLNGSSRYYYFYDWDVDFNYQECFSDVDSVLVDVIPLATEGFGESKFIIEPNPAYNFINIQLNKGSIKTVNIYSIGGEQLFKFNDGIAQSAKIDVTSLASGVYVIEIIDNSGQSYRDKFLIVK